MCWKKRNEWRQETENLNEYKIRDVDGEKFTHCRLVTENKVCT